MSAYKQFDRSTLNLLPLDQRIHDIDIDIIKDVNDEIPEFDNPDIKPLAQAIVTARRRYDASVIMMYGAHVIRTGNGMFMIDLMKRGLITHFATNGAGSIHDFEFSMIGHTCESVAKYISEGQFGLWTETGLVNEAINAGAKEGLGWGESIGKYIWENNFPYREKSVLAMGYHLQVPCTVHVGVGNDIVHEHPNCIGANMGACSYRDFLIYANSASKLDHGVFLDFGSAIAGPEVYLNALDMARNAAAQQGKTIGSITAAAFDLIDIDKSEGFVTPEKPASDPRYYYRPWRNVLVKNAAEGGTSFYIKGEHKKTVPNLAREVVR
ncbi:MAG: hypothetical protein ACI4N6_03310, partial [Eubacteriales bacterium]